MYCYYKHCLPLVPPKENKLKLKSLLKRERAKACDDVLQNFLSKQKLSFVKPIYLILFIFYH
jgi:hypothetical protein